MSLITVMSALAEVRAMCEELALLVGERGFQREVGHAHDAVDGRAQLVAHVGHELALGAVGGLGGVQRALQRLPARLSFGHAGAPTVADSRARSSPSSPARPPPAGPGGSPGQHFAQRHERALALLELAAQAGRGAVERLHHGPELQRHAIHE
jgi:hypothetical protein